MKPAAPHFIDIDALRLGMLVHLEGGWMSHPFPLNTFRIASAEQIDTLRKLGLRRVRWSPEAAGAGPFAAAPIGAAASRRAATDASATEPAAPVPPDPSVDGGPNTATGGRPDAARVPAEARPPERGRAAARRCEQQFKAAGRDCRQALDHIAMRPEQARHETETLASTLLENMLGTEDLCVRLMADAAGDRTASHALNVMVLSMLMGRSFGLSEAELLDLGVGAMLHDIGKGEMPLRLRHRCDDFTTAEHRDYEEHVAHGLAHARRMGLNAGATLVIAQHHELADGSGFPLRLKADRMTTAARIVAIVDRYDNLCNPHLQARGLTPHEAVSWLFAQGKDRYETSLLNGFIRMVGVYPPGSTVQLTDDRHALVLAVNSGRPLKPQVLVHEPGTPRDQAVPLDLERTDGLGIRRSVRPAQLPAAALDYLAPRERVCYFFEPARETEPVC